MGTTFDRYKQMFTFPEVKLPCIHGTPLFHPGSEPVHDPTHTPVLP